MEPDFTERSQKPNNDYNLMMKTRKYFPLLAMLLFSVALTYNAYAACSASADPEQNTGHCRPNSNGGDDCIYVVASSGPACNGSVVIKPPAIEQ